MSDVRSVEVLPYHGLVAVSPVGFIPGVGQIRMIRIRTAGEHARDFACTVGRHTTVSRVALTIRHVAEVWS